MRNYFGEYNPSLIQNVILFGVLLSFDQRWNPFPTTTSIIIITPSVSNIMIITPPLSKTMIIMPPVFNIMTISPPLSKTMIIIQPVSNIMVLDWVGQLVSTVPRVEEPTWSSRTVPRIFPRVVPCQDN